MPQTRPGPLDPRGRPPEHPFHVWAPSDGEVPDEIAYLLPLTMDTSLHGDAEALVLLPIMLLWVVDANLEQLYFPAEPLAWLHLDLTIPPARVLAQLDEYAQYMNGTEEARHAGV